MTDTQRSLSGYKSKIAEPGEFDNPNEGKTALNDQDEYVLKLMKFPHVVVQKMQKEKKDGTKFTEEQERAACEFEEPNTKNIVVAFFRVDKLNFSDDEKYESGVIRFFKKIGHPLVDGVEPNWDDYFVVGMRFRARVVVGTNATKDGNRTIKTPNGKYYLDIPTCRRLQSADTAGEDFPSNRPPKPSEDANLLANAKLLAKGAKDSREAIIKLQSIEPKVSKELFMAFFNADLEGKVEYPI